MRQPVTIRFLQGFGMCGRYALYRPVSRVRERFDAELEDFELTVAEHAGGFATGTAARAATGDDAAEQGSAEEEGTSGHLTETLKHAGARFTLHHIAHGTGAQAALRIHVFIVHRVHENLHVRVDVKLFIRMLQNLIQNGIQYGKSGKRIVIELDRVVTVIKIRVINFGEKIGEEDLPNLFERFYRAEKSRSSYAGGMGMGLAIAKSIAELHGGTIQVESDDNRTFFEIILPDSLA